MRAVIITPYTGSGLYPDCHRPLVADLWPMTCTDITGMAAGDIDAGDKLQIIADCTPDTLAAIQADARFTVLEVQP